MKYIRKAKHMTAVKPYPPYMSYRDEKKPKPSPAIAVIALNPRDWNESMVARIDESIR